MPLRERTASPKSNVFASPRLVTKMFASLMSRRRTPLVCGGIKRVRHLNREREKDLGVHGPTGNYIFQRCTFQKPPSQ